MLDSLHWLPVKFRIEFKILLLTYKALHGMGPVYIKEMLKLYVPTKSCLRSSKQFLLCVPKSRLVSCGDRSFSIVAPRLWNDLPYEIKCAQSVDSFKQNLKTYLYSRAFAI